MSGRVEWVGVINGKPTVEVDRWSEVELWVDEMGSLDDGRVTFGVQVEGFMNDAVYLTVTDTWNRKEWRFLYNPQSNDEIRFDRCVAGRRGAA